ncbi:MAG: RDD family protein [Dokdonella sp.]
MESNKHALVLTGELLPGFESGGVWKAVGDYFRIDPTRLNSEVLARVPMTIKESDDLADLERRKLALIEFGAISEIHPSNTGSYFVLVDNIPRGPLPRSYIDQRMRQGVWPSGLKAAAVGTSDWRVMTRDEGVAAPIPITPMVPMAAPMPQAEADTVAAKIARVADSIASRKEPQLPLPAGDAIHAGFWRRCAAYLIDSLVLFVPSVILMLIPILGILIYFVGRWLYFALMESSPTQATLGKRLMGIIATDGKGQRLSFGQASGRYFAGAISYITLYIGYALAGWTARKQALHDLIADTCVVFATVQPGEPLPTVRPAMPWYGWAANFLLLAVFPISILAAIALPAYNDYLVRSKVANAFVEADTAKIEVVEALASGQGCPSHSRESNDVLVESIRFSGSAPDCVVTLSFATSPATPSVIRGQAVEWQNSETAGWRCSSMITPKYLPSSCRQ